MEELSTLNFVINSIEARLQAKEIELKSCGTDEQVADV